MGRPEFLEGHGAIVTARNQRTGYLWSRAEPYCATRDALRMLVSELRRRNAKGEEWRIVTISTPTTIRDDLRRTPALSSGPGRTAGKRSGERPEVRLLRAVDALDLLEERPPKRIIPGLPW
jgi:hypothetical protein